MSRVIEPLPTVYLRPGDMHFSAEQNVVITVLGSCLSVTMFSRSRCLGGICHSLLPQCDGQTRCLGECLEGFKYVACSIRRMVRLFDRQRVRRGDIEVKCFGGADMFTKTIDRPDFASIGRQNITAAEQVLKSEGLKMHAVDVGGLLGRKIYFYTHTGEVLLKRLRKQNGSKADSL